MGHPASDTLPNSQTDYIFPPTPCYRSARSQDGDIRHHHHLRPPCAARHRYVRIDPPPAPTTWPSAPPTCWHAVCRLVAERMARCWALPTANWFKPRPAYRFHAEDSIYVGIEAGSMGRALLQALVERRTDRWSAQAHRRDWRFGQRRFHRAAPCLWLYRGRRTACHGLEAWRLAGHRADGKPWAPQTAPPRIMGL